MQRFYIDVDSLSMTSAFLGSGGLSLEDKGARWPSESPLIFAERNE